MFKFFILMILFQSLAYGAKKPNYTKADKPQLAISQENIQVSQGDIIKLKSTQKPTQEQDKTKNNTNVAKKGADYFMVLSSSSVANNPRYSYILVAPVVISNNLVYKNSENTVKIRVLNQDCYLIIEALRAIPKAEVLSKIDIKENINLEDVQNKFESFVKW